MMQKASPNTRHAFIIFLDTLVPVILAFNSADLFSPIVYTIYKTNSLTYQNHG